MTFQKELINSLKSNGSKIAIDNGESSFSYNELFSTSNKIAEFLWKEGLGKETLIGLQLNNYTHLIASIIGTVNARCVFVPMDGSLPIKRLKTIIKDINLKYIITFKGNNIFDKNDNIPGIRYIYYEDIISGLPVDSNEQFVYPEFDPEDSIYIYFTSGSTGNPKGIIGKNKSLLQFLQWETETYNIDNEVRSSQFVSPYFDAFLRDIFISLLKGGTLCIPPQEDDFYTPEKLTKWIDEKKISLIHCVPSLFRVINNDLIGSGNYRNLKYVFLSGERIYPKELSNWYKLFENSKQLVNLYGTTETTMIRTFYNIMPEDVNKDKIPIGKPINDTGLLISKKGFEPCNKLIPGNLYIISDYITKGYLNNPELTCEKFLKINQGTTDESMAYLTGDLARELADGRIELLGREDRQIKLRGVRIELDEIEVILNKCEDVETGVITTDKDEFGNELILAFLKKAAVHCPSQDIRNKVKEYLDSNLPTYMLPSDIIEVDEFPLLNNGKINYKKLIENRITRTIEEPKNDMEAQLLLMWKEIIGNIPISTDDSFHSLGGNSIKIMRLIGNIYKQFNVRVSLLEIFNNLTIKKQAELIANAKKDKAFDILKSEIMPFYNLSAAQERVFYSYQLNKNSTSYNLPMAWEMTGERDKDKLMYAFERLIERHESLRTEFAVENGKMLQIIKDQVDFTIENINVSEDQVDNAIIEFIRPFDLNRAPLFRCGIIQADNGKNIIVIDLHHIICDGISQNILFSDFIKLYNHDQLIPLEIQYKDYAEWEYKFKLSDDYISLREYWLKIFEDDVPELKLPTSNININPLSFEGGKVSFQIQKADLMPVIDYLKDEDIATFSGLYTIYLLFISQITGQEDVVIGIANSGRVQASLESVVGMFVKTLPIRYKIDYKNNFKELVKDVHKNLVEANSKCIYDLADIMNELNKRKSNPIKSLFQVMFVFQNFDRGNQATNDFSIYPFENASSKYPITLFVAEDTNAVHFRLEYQVSYFQKADIERLIGDFRKLVLRVSDNIENNITDIISGEVISSSLNEEEISFDF
jgi:mycobactin peptide synthetase MbtE